MCSSGYSAVGLVSPKFPVNIGSVLRAAGCFGSAMVAVTGERYSKRDKKKRFITDTPKCYKKIPFLEVDNLRNIIPFDCYPIAVDLTSDAVNIFSFHHPPRAFYIFGPEDGTLGEKVTSWCKKTIFIPTKWCLNLAACVNVVLYDRMMQMEKLKQLKS